MEKQTTRPAHLRLLFLLTSIYSLNFTGRMILSPLLPAMEQDLGMNHGQAGSLFLMTSIGYFFTMIGSGFVASRLGHRRCIIFAALLGGSALLLAGLGHSLITLFGAFFLLGLTAGLYFPSGVATITNLIPQHHWGRSLGLHETGTNLGMVLAPFLAEAFVSWLSWGSGLALFGVLLITAGLTYLFFGPKELIFGQAPMPASIGRICRRPAFWHMVIVFSLATGGSMGLYSMMPLFLVTAHDWARPWANTVVALSRIPSIISVLLGGWLADRAGLARSMMGCLLLNGIMIVSVGLLSDRLLMISIFLQTAMASCFFPIAYAAMAHLGRPEERNLIVALIVAQGVLIGGGAIPTAIGFLSQTWSFSHSVVATGVLALAAASSLLFYKPPRLPVDSRQEPNET
ncbi:MAG: MFS transporter [Deltaproteobacteria bacterium]|nr:MFS transporter [Deltaproteobacteria bacterium]